MTARAAGVPLLAHRPRVLVLHLRAPLFELAHAHVDSLQQIERLEAGGDDRHPIPRGERAVLVEAHHRADVTGGEKGVHPPRRRAEDRLHRRRDQHVRDQQREVAHAPAARLDGGQRVSGRGGLEADREEDDLAIGVALGERQRVERRVDDAHVAAARLDREQIPVSARDAQHVAEGTEDHLGPGGDGEPLVDDARPA